MKAWIKQKTRYHLPRGLQPHNWVVTRLVRTWLRTIAAMRIANVNVIGKKNIPKRGPVIIAGNHPSVIDPVYLWGAIPRNATAIAKAELWKVPGLNILLRMLGHIPIVRGNLTSAKSTVDAAIKVLNHGGIILIYPEGGCSYADGSMKPFKSGLARMAAETGASIVPVGIIGSNVVYPQGGIRRFPLLRHPVQLTFGAPIDTDGLSHDEILTITRQRILELSTPRQGYTMQS